MVFCIKFNLSLSRKLLHCESVVWIVFYLVLSMSFSSSNTPFNTELWKIATNSIEINLSLIFAALILSLDYFPFTKPIIGKIDFIALTY